VNIVCHGHSVSSGYFKTPVVDTFDVNPDRLHHVLKERFHYAVINVFVTGIGGEDSLQGEARFTRDVLTHQPDVILIDTCFPNRTIPTRAVTGWSWTNCNNGFRRRGERAPPPRRPARRELILAVRDGPG
jgi:acyl-CoA thioesterase I